MTIITTSWDKSIKVHLDDRDEQKNPTDKRLRCREMCHQADIISGDYSHNL